MNTVIACGGTGGHLFPGLAIAEVLRARGHEVLLFISEKEIDALVVEGRTEFRFEKLPTVALPSPFSPAILGFVRRFHESLSLCRSIFRKFQPQVVLGMGGFTSTAPILAGRIRGVPTFLHESNAIPGKANRYTARFVRAVLLGFKECAAYFPTTATEVTGTPIRATLRRIDRGQALQKLGLKNGIPTLLVMGGSQGASGINQAIIKAMSSFQDFPLQVIHLAGARDASLLEDNYRREKIPAYVADFYHHMEEVYSAADLVIARSGAASLSELAAFGLPAVLVPYPYAADDHQTRNAEIFVRANAALMMKESEFSPEELAKKVRDLLGNGERLQTMSNQMAALAPQNAAAMVVETIERYSQPHDAVAA
ncbi:MAG TPA: undecaprenyldiphospho-muramoylpentapeptide beta-N-acetylglucosaminyltransferase [Chthoniobacterales bacterium]|jgi:UDP-N-acetylglucosamine--N-acetylmuramyl-(pentapeptide) pyrophosphoryl-undecaprenol N-acetylglucosamine transferase|nr:undecaprenyldiphospho-muramoylpentapeptide beta-N-acetylglucosaminyltransferase [Chthoniobacterales bacterium]